MQIKRSPYYQNAFNKKWKKKKQPKKRVFRRKKSKKLGCSSVYCHRFVDQAISDPNKGDCMRAAIASLLEMPLSEVPDFANVEPGSTWYGYSGLFAFMELHGWGVDYVWNPDFIGAQGKDMIPVDIRAKTERNGGIRGLFYASMPSQTYDGVNHAVIVDHHLHVVHDPNPNRKALNMPQNYRNIEFVLVTYPISGAL